MIELHKVKQVKHYTKLITASCDALPHSELSLYSQRENVLIKRLLSSVFHFSWEPSPVLLSLNFGRLLRPFTGAIAH